MDTVHPKMQMNLLKDKNNIKRTHQTAPCTAGYAKSYAPESKE
jgi:hypothetical protein